MIYFLLAWVTLAEANWTRVFEWNIDRFWVITYLHQGPIDSQFPEFPIYLTVSRDMQKDPVKRYAELSSTADEASVTQITSQGHVGRLVESAMRSTRVYLADPCVDLYWDNDEI
jgi:hypothetical protein